MKIFFTIILLFSFLLNCFAKDVQVKGYTKSNGTYVAPHVRSSPDSVKWNNYGSASTFDKAYSVPTQERDQDGDGIPNRLDKDDNNDGKLDDDK